MVDSVPCVRKVAGSNPTESARRIAGGRLFQHRGPAAEKARSPKYEVRKSTTVQ